MTQPPVHDTHEAPHVPLFKTWRGVYIFVLVCFVAYVVILTAFTMTFS